MLDPLSVYICLGSGALGGALFHSYWLIKVEQGSLASPIQPDSGQRSDFDLKRRLGLFALSIGSGAAAAFLVWSWFAPELRAGKAVLEQVAVYCAIAGLSGDGALGILRKLANL